MLKRYKFEVDCLNSWPDHPILLQRLDICALKLCTRIRALHVRHAAEENKEIGRCKGRLICEDTRGNGGIGALELDFRLQESIP